jgi:MHS family shikimate/dehydroshikimate transporter-like MFS transporter
VLATGVRLAETVSSNLIKSFGLTYATLHLGLARGSALGALMAASLIGLAAMPLFGLIGDRIGARRLTLMGNGLLMVLAVPCFALMETREEAEVWGAFIVLFTFGPMLLLSVQATFFTQLFRTSVRYTGLSVAYQVSSIVGGFTPLIALWLLQLADNAPWLVAGFLAIVAAISAVCTVTARLRA